MKRVGWSALAISSALVAASVTSAGAAVLPRAEAGEWYVKKVTIGHSVQGRPIVATYKGYPQAEHVVVVLGQMHGNEKAGPRVVHRMLKIAKPRANTGVWYIVTMNPDGSRLNTRTNARKVDLNRNWPTTGWTSKGKGTITWGGPKAQSEPETRAMIAFLRERKPDYVASIHQPYGAIAKTGIDKAWEARLKQYLFLPVKPIGVGTPSGKTSPTLTGWYNRWYKNHGTSTTIELRSSVSDAYVRKHGAPGILKAAKGI